MWLSTGFIWGSFSAETVSTGKLSYPHTNASSKSTPSSSSLLPCFPTKTVYAIRFYPISLLALCFKEKIMMMMMMMIIMEYPHNPYIILLLVHTCSI
jgi:hypothetical protein